LSEKTTKAERAETRVHTLRLQHSDDGILVLDGTRRARRTIVPHKLDGIIPGYLVTESGGLVYHIPTDNVSKAILMPAGAAREK
jgi:hypothetical protein